MSSKKKSICTSARALTGESNQNELVAQKVQVAAVESEKTEKKTKEDATQAVFEMTILVAEASQKTKDAKILEKTLLEGDKEALQLAAKLAKP